MQRAGRRWLPKHDREAESIYQARLARSILYNGFCDTIEGLGSKPFTRNITLAGDVPQKLASIVKDADRRGTKLTQFAQQCFADALVHGITHIFVDYPPTGGAQSLEVERVRGLRPYFIHVPAVNLIGWRVSKDDTGKEHLDEVRIRDVRTEIAEDYSEQEVTYILVLRLQDWVRYRIGPESPEAVEVERGINSIGRVPLVTMSLKSDGFMRALPPLEDLAYINLAHWQSQSDQRNILHIARCPILAESGVAEADGKAQPFVVGPTQIRSYQDPQARAYWVETSGASIGAGRQDLVDLEVKMQILGNQPLVNRTGEVTATGEAINEAKSSSAMQCWIRFIEAGLEEAYALAGRYVGVKLPDNFSVDIWSDFAIGLKAAEESAWLLQARSAREIDRMTFLQEVRRRGLLAETVNIDTVAERLEEEGPAFGDLMPMPAQAPAGAAEGDDDAQGKAMPGTTDAKALAASGTIQDAALNGAQIASLKEFALEVGTGELALESGIALITASFPTIDEAEARRILAPQAAKAKSRPAPSAVPAAAAPAPA